MKLVFFIFFISMFMLCSAAGYWEFNIQFEEEGGRILDIGHIYPNCVLSILHNSNFVWAIVDVTNQEIIHEGELSVATGGFATAWLSEDELMLIGGYLVYDCQIINLSNLECTLLENSPLVHCRYAHEAATIQGGPYEGWIITGGGWDWNEGITWEMFNPDTQTWSLIAPCPVSRKWFSLESFENGWIMTAGGSLQTGNLTIYKPELDSWTTISCDVVFGQRSASQKISDTEAFVTGGFLNGNYSDQYIIFDIETMSINEIGVYPDGMPGRDSPGICLVNDRLYILCGYNPNFGYNLKTCFSLDLISDEWTIEPETNIAHGHPLVAVITDQRIFLASDNDTGHTETFSWNYEPYVVEYDIPATGNANESVDFVITVTDSLNDSLAINLDYGDGNQSGWSELIQSPYTFEFTHNYTEPGEYEIAVQLADQYYFQDPNIHNSITAWDTIHTIMIEPAGAIGKQEVPGSVLALYQNYPNPFNPETTISFSIPEDNHVKLVIFNLRGQRIKTLISRNLQRGYYSLNWDGRDEKGISVQSGIYLCQIKIGDYSNIMKMLLLK